MKMIRRQSLRPRQIDIYGKMLIIRSVDELNLFEDENGSDQKIASLDDLNSVPYISSCRRNDRAKVV